MHDHSRPPYSAKAELAMARSALDEADPGHAAHHAAGAIALDPSDPAALELVDHLIAQRANPLARALSFLRREDDPAPIFPRGDFFGYVAVRARARWKRGQYSEAFSALISVMLAVPHVDFSPWVLELLAEAKEKGAAVDPRPAFTAFAETSAPFIGLIQLRAGERAAFEPWVTINRALLGTQPPAEAQDLLSMTTAGHLRRAGRSEEALLLLDQVAATENVLVQRGLALRALGRFDEAVAVFEDAERHSGDPKHRAEIARARYDQGRFDLALQGFSGSEDLELALAADACRLALGQPRERPDVESLFGRVPSYDELRRVLLGDGSQVQMSDATTNALANFVAEHPDLDAPRSVKMGVSCLESPSVLLALALFAHGEPTMSELPYTFESVPERSPSEPLVREGARLWLGEPGRPRQALPPPPEAVSKVVQAVAESPATAMAELLRLARQAPVDALAAQDLLAAMLYPPPLPKGRSPDVHVFGWQRAAALLLSVQDRSLPWHRARRRESLRALILGPPDWTTAAGLLALTEVLLDEPEALEDARGWLDTLASAAPSAGHCPWATALAHLHARVPRLRRELLTPLAPWLSPPPPDPEPATPAEK